MSDDLLDLARDAYERMAWTDAYAGTAPPTSTRPLLRSISNVPPARPKKMRRARSSIRRRCASHSAANAGSLCQMRWGRVVRSSARTPATPEL